LCGRRTFNVFEHALARTGLTGFSLMVVSCVICL
jgi:hypothetical protein